MADTMEIIISAVDQASSIFQSIVGSVTDMGSSIEEVIGMTSEEFNNMAANVGGFQDAISGIDDSTIQELAEDLGLTTDEVENLINTGAGLGSIPFNEASAGADELEQEVTEADDAINTLNDDLGVINSSMFMQLGQQVGELGTQAEGMAQDINTAAISVGQLATNASIAEPQMISLINNISNATFPQSEAMAYVEALNQMGVSADNLGASATNMDRINDATGIGYDKVVKLTQGLQSMGISADNLPSSFNAIAFAQANVTGGADTLQRTLMRQASTINEYGLNVDQVVLIMEKLSAQGISTTKMGTELSSVLKENDGDIRAIEESLGMESGALENAASKTGEYEGQLQRLADEEAEHKTILDQLGAAWEDVSLSIGQFMTPFLGVIGLLGQVGSFGLQVKGLKELYSLTKSMTEIEIIDSAVKSGKAAIMSVVTAATTLYGLAIGVLTGEIGLAAAATAAWNAILAVNPVMLVVLALAALVAIIYEVGKAFGWWTDVSSMIDAIKAGLTEMWEAFINHPDVQAAITVIGEAFNSLWNAIQQAGQAVMDFFGISESGDFDIVNALIMGIGGAWDTLKGIVTGVGDTFTNVYTTIVDTFTGIYDAVVGAFMAIYEAITGVLNSIYEQVKPTADLISQTIISAWSMISSYLSPIFSSINNLVVSLIGIFNQFRNGQIDLPTAIMMALSLLWNGYFTILTQIAQLVLRIARQVISYGLRMGSQFMNNIMNYIRQLPGKIYSALVAAVGRITSAGSQWVSNARSQASNVVNTVYNTLSGIPGKISSALAGVVSAITKPFEDAYNKVASKVDQIKDKVSEISGGVIALAGEESYGRASLLDNAVTSETNTTAAAVVVDNSPVTVDHNLNVTLDLKNVPSGMDSDTLIAALTDQKVLSALTGSSDFQLLDGKAKERLNLKVNRSRGV